MNDYTSEYTFILIITLVISVGALALIAWGWRSRQRRQQDVSAPMQVPPTLLETEPTAAADGMYVSTVRGRDWLDRIAVHGLGVRTDARLEVHPEGVLVLRSGSSNFLIPAAHLTDVRAESGMQGKFVERDGLLVLSWMLGDQEVSTGFRTRTTADRAPLEAAARALTGHERTTTDPADR